MVATAVMGAGAGLFAQGIQSGLSALNLAMGGDSAETIAAYNASYNNTYQKFTALDAKTTAEDNIAAINQDKILSNVAIQMNKAQAEAAAQVSAAVAGVEGSSVDTGMYQIGANAAQARARVNAEADQLTEQQLANVNAGQTAYSSIPKLNQPSAMQGALMGLSTAVSSMSSSDIAGMEAQLDTWSK